jgi:hypothetical protein
VKGEHLAALRQQVRTCEEDGQNRRIGPTAGYVHATVTAAASHPCTLADFQVNVRVDGRLRWTLPASSDRHLRGLPLGTASGNAVSFRLRLEGLDTQEVRKLMIDPERVTVALEVPGTTVKLAETADPDAYRRTLESVRRRCAQVEVIQGGGRFSRHVSTSTASGGDEIRLEDLLGRLPSPEPAAWGRGVAGDYLRAFRGREGVDALEPESPGDCAWCVFLNGTELSGDYRGRPVRPSDHVRLVYTSSRQYWGAVEDWRGYAAFYRKLHTLQGTEYRFWAEIDGYDNARGRPWDALARKAVREQAVQLRDRYRALLAEPLPPAVALPPAVKRAGRSSNDGSPAATSGCPRTGWR